MYLEYFGLDRLPFTISPDPDFLYPSHGHQEALAHLSYSLTDQGGLICLTGEVGTGKTTLCRALIETIPDGDHVAYIFNPQLSPVELLESICDELGIEYSPGSSLKELYADLNLGLLRCFSKHQRVICVIDEAQSMPAALLEQVRLLTNLETHKDKLLTLVLVGQPELREILARYDLRQLNQRITARYHLNHLNLQDTANYLEHRLVCAGGQAMLFEKRAVQAIHKASAGVPRLINSIADRALLGTYATGGKTVNAVIARQAIREVLGDGHVSAASAQGSSWKLPFIAVSVVLTVVVIALAMFIILGSPGQTVDVAAASSAPESREVSDITDTAADDGSIESISDTIATVISEQIPVLAEPEPVSPISLLADFVGVSEAVCDDPVQSGYRCLWVDWSIADLRRSGQAVAVADPEGKWQLLDSTVSAISGEALVLWQQPPGYNEAVNPGETAEVVRWVRARLGINWNQEWTSIGPGGVQIEADPDFYDPLLERAVAEFQIANGLKADRIIGPKTLMYLQKDF